MAIASLNDIAGSPTPAPASHTASFDDIAAVQPSADSEKRTAPAVSGLGAEQPVSASGTASLNDIVAVHPSATGTASIGDIAAVHPLPETVKGSESWLGHAWDWANKPLWNLNKENKGGFTGGAEDVASGFTSPLSIGLTVGTLGTGWGLRALGIAGSELPVVVQGLKTLVGAGFTAQQAIGAIQTTPRVLDALKTGDYDEAKRLAVHAVAGFGGAYLGARGLVPEAQSLGERTNFLKPREGYTAARQELGRYLADRTANAQEAKLFVENAREALPAKDKISLGAISRYIEAGGNREVLQDRLDALSTSKEVAENYSAKERADLLSKYDRAMNLSPEEMEFADKLRGQLADNFTLAHQHGVINSAVENYLTHIWEADENNPAVNRTLHQASTGRFSTNVSMARERTFATSFEGEMLGRKLKTDDPIALTANHTQAVRNAIAARGFLDRLRDVNASDGRPMVVMAGAGTPVEDATLIHPDRVRSIQINKSTLQNLIRTGRLDDLIDSGAVVRLPSQEPENLSGNRTASSATPTAPVRNPDEIYMRPTPVSRGTNVEGAAVPLNPEEHAALEQQAGRKLTTQEANLMLRARAEQGMVGALGTYDEASAIREEHRAKLEQPDPERYAKNTATAAPISRSTKETLPNGTVVYTGAEGASRDISQLEQTLRDQKGYDDPKIARLRRAVMDYRDQQGITNKDELWEDTYRTLLRRALSTEPAAPAPATPTVEIPREVRLPAGPENGQPTQPAPANDRYAWNPHDFRAIDHPAFRDWIFGANDTAGNPIYVKTEMRVHPEAADYIERGIGADKSAIRENALGRAALATSSEAKTSLLAFSPFHVMQEGLRAVMTGISPFGVDRWDLNTDPILRAGVEHGLTLGKDYRGLSDLTEGVAGNSRLIEKVPVLGRLQTQLHKFLFDDYIPSLKARAYRNLVERYGAANPTWSPDKVMSEAAADTNSRFGGINYKMLGRSLTSQDASRLTVLAPDWLESEVRFMARALNPGSEGSIARRDLARIGLYTFAAARVLNMLTSGKPHLEAPFGVIYKDRQGRAVEYSFRTPLTDLTHAVSDPAEFLRGRANPLTVRTAAEAYTGRDEYGRRVTPGQQVSDVIKNVSPIPVQSIAQRITGARPDMNTAEQIAKAAGASVYQYRTEAEKLAAQLSSDRVETGPVDKTELARHRAKLQAEDAVRAGDKFDLTGFSLRERKEIHANAKLTPLQARFSRLPMRDALQVWNAATRAEKTQLRHELAKKRQSYLERANANLSREERQHDPTYQQVKTLNLEQYRRANEALGEPQ